MKIEPVCMIQLHDSDGDEVWVRADRIVALFVDGDGTGSTVSLGDERSEFSVAEPPADVIAAMRSAFRATT